MNSGSERQKHGEYLCLQVFSSEVLSLRSRNTQAPSPLPVHTHPGYAHTLPCLCTPTLDMLTLSPDCAHPSWIYSHSPLPVHTHPGYAHSRAKLRDLPEDTFSFNFSPHAFRCSLHREQGGAGMAAHKACDGGKGNRVPSLYTSLTVG